ncbi:MAG: hypothetical protein J0M17_04855 [Planctomycetes bacterium]|nr:hypothetical protein [Planctomycetota bacterium]
MQLIDLRPTRLQRRSTSSAILIPFFTPSSRSFFVRSHDAFFAASQRLLRHAFVADRNGSPTKPAPQSKRPDDRVIVGPSEFFEL